VIRDLRAGLTCAFLLAVLSVTGCTVSPGGAEPTERPHTPDLLPPPALPSVTWALTVNGHTAHTNGNWESRFAVRPGQNLLIKAVLIVPDNIKVTALWLGISPESHRGKLPHRSPGPVGYGPNWRPTVTLNPLLAHTFQVLAAGPHTFRLHWRVPNLHRGASLLLMSAWSSPRPNQDDEGPIARFTLN